jgi:hypothetical protein
VFISLAVDRDWQDVGGCDHAARSIVGLVIEQGLRDHASEVFFQPEQASLKIRFLVGGALLEALSLSKTLASDLVSCIKNMADGDRTVPGDRWDGVVRIYVQSHGEVEIGVSTVETTWGEGMILDMPTEEVPKPHQAGQRLGPFDVRVPDDDASRVSATLSGRETAGVAEADALDRFAPQTWPGPCLKWLSLVRSEGSQSRSPSEHPVRPGQLTKFVGLDRAVGEVSSLLHHTRLVTMTIPPGDGKDGTWFVDLAPLRSGDPIWDIAASGLGIYRVGEPARLAVLDHLAPLECLILIANCEQMVAETALLVDALLRGCPKVRILVTSREPLKTPGEVCWRMPPLRYEGAPEHSDLGYAPLTACRLAVISQQKRNWTRAREAWTFVLDSGSEQYSSAALLGLGTVAEQQGDEEEALSHWRRAIDRGDPECSARAGIMLGCRTLERAEYGEAEAAFRRVWESGNQEFCGLALLGIGVVHYEQGDLGRAAEHLRQAREGADGRVLPLIDEYRMEAVRRIFAASSAPPATSGKAASQFPRSRRIRGLLEDLKA